MGILGADGAFAEHVAVPVANLHARARRRRRRGGGLHRAARRGVRDPRAGAGVERGQRCVVLGDGKLGLLVAQVLAAAGARVLAVGKHDDKLAILRAARDRDRHASTTGIAPGPMSSSRPPAAPRASRWRWRRPRPRGTLVLKSTVAATRAARPGAAGDRRDHRGRLALRARSRRRCDGAGARRVDVRSLISARLPLRDGVEALRSAAQPGTLKVLIEP